MLLSLHIYPSFLVNESRILKETHSIAKLKLAERIVVLGFWKNNLVKEEKIEVTITFVRLNCLFSKNDNIKFLNIFSFLIFYVRCFLYAIRNKPSVIHAHSLTVLPLTVAIKIFTGCKLIYDPHELETETNESKGLRKSIARLIEKMLIKKASAIITVSTSIKDWYKKTYSLKNAFVVKNIPERKWQTSTEHINLKKILDIPENEILFLYQGMLSTSRGVEKILDCFTTISDKQKHILFLGDGPLRSKIENVSTQQANVHHKPAVPSYELLKYTKGADVGIHIIQNTCLNHFYCLPNKVFEYAVAGKPIIISNFPDIVTEFSEVGSAWFIDPSTNDLQVTIESITNDLLMIKSTKAEVNRNRWAWEESEEVYQEIYKSLINEN